MPGSPTDVSSYLAIVVATKDEADTLVAQLDEALGYPNETTAHATDYFQHCPDGSVPDDQQPYAVHVDDACAAAAAAIGGYDMPYYLQRSWWGLVTFC